jgi:hypothetical protein
LARSEELGHLLYLLVVVVSDFDNHHTHTQQAQDNNNNSGVRTAAAVCWTRGLASYTDGSHIRQSKPRIQHHYRQ